LQTKEMIGNLRAAHHHRYELPLLSAPVEFVPGAVPLDPYALGLLLGDGCSSSDEKFIPEPYLLNSAGVRLGVLQGLLDSGGGEVTGHGRSCRIQFTTVSDQLRDDVVFLVQSLGGIVHSRTRKADGRGPGLARGREVHHRADAHALDIRLPCALAPFRLVEKAQKYAAGGGGRPRRYIDRIEPAGTEEAVCISVAAADSLYVTEDFLLTHNTLNDAFIILDEAQNTTAEQMKMFLTRLGFGSKIVVTGDITQVDLPGGARSGLRTAMDILSGIDDIHFCELTSADVVRHRLVADIVDAYARAAEQPSLSNRAQRRSSQR
jgi:phosphate starvation-inducible PhoH-like protein